MNVVTALAFMGSLLAPYRALAQQHPSEPIQVELAPAASDTPSATREVAAPDAKNEAVADETQIAEGNDTTAQAAPDDVTRPRAQQGLPDGSSKSAVTPQAISLPKAEGSIQGMGESFSPNLSAGTGTFTVPIALPPGRAGVQPSLALSYSTSGGNGPIGVGWSLDPPFIARQTDRGLPRYNDSTAWQAQEDRFIYNGGQELVPIDSAAAAAIDGGTTPAELSGWQQYRARIEGAFMRFFRAPDGLSWVVQDKTGTRYEFGLLPVSSGPAEAIDASANALLSEFDGGSGRVYQWNLTRMSDAHGSTVYYLYNANNGQRYLEDIYYVSPRTCEASTPAAQRNCTQTLANYGRRVHLVYEARDDVFDSYTTTWRIQNALRLHRIEITAANGAPGQRTLVRRYHLRYDPGSFVSLLSEVQVEGRPETVQPNLGPVGNPNIAESTLNEQIIGALLPPMRFTYSTTQHVTSTLVPGFAGLDGTAHESLHSPPHSVSEERADLFDVNSDGLPDLIVTDPARFKTPEGDPAVGVFFNGFEGPNATPSEPGSFSDGIAMAIPVADSASLNLGNLNISPMDADGDGRSDLLYMPRLANYGYFTPTRLADGPVAEASPASQGWAFSKRNVVLPRSDLDPRLDFGRDGSRIHLVDVNNDHLIDAVRTTGTEMQTFLNLGWLPHGEGRFGSATFSEHGWELSTAPISSCVLQLGTPIDFADPEVRLADMNGDGIQDIVAIRQGRVVYWPGRGTGSWGQGDYACPRGKGDNREVEMENPPQELNSELADVFFEDVDMDGTADVVQVRFDAVDVWFNQAGHSFTQRAIVDGTPFAPAFAPRLRFADIDGSGTTDIVYANAEAWQWVDLMGGRRPRLLVGVENGLGGETLLEYGSSAREYLRDLADAQRCLDSSCDRFTWNKGDQACDDELDEVPGHSCVRSTGSPVVSTVVTAVETRDNFEQLGLEGFAKRTEYRYHDGYYEGIEQEFRGFGAADAVEVGDETEPTLITRAYFDQGRRPGAIATSRLADNPDEVRKGRSYLTEVFDERGTYLSSSHATLNVRKLLAGLDGRAVSYAYVGQSDELLYDVAVFSPRSDLRLDLPAVIREQAGATLEAVTANQTETRSLRVRSERYVQLRTTTGQVDNVGNLRVQTLHGRIRGEDGEPLPNEQITRTNVPVLCNGDQWTWRTAESYVTGYGDTTRLSHTTNRYATGVCDLVDAQEAADVASPFDFSGQVPAEALTQTSTPIEASTRFDVWGNAVQSCAGGDLATGSDSRCLRFGSVDYDSAYGQVPVTERIATGRDSGGVFTLLTTTAQWDVGIDSMLSVTDPNNLINRISYDGLGRMRSATPPQLPTCTTSPLTRIDYQLADQLSGPFNLVSTTTTTSCDSANPKPIHSQVVVDGLGRTRVSVVDAEDASDPTLASRWQRSGLTRFNRRGAVVEAFQSDLIPIAGFPFSGLAAPTGSIPSTFAFYDAFGRETADVAEDGSTTRTVYHALGTDVWDANDLDPSSPDYGTPTSERQDGHGQVVDQVLRNRQPGRSEVEYYRLFMDYRADGKLVQVARAQTVLDRPRSLETVVTRTGKPHQVGRLLVYDTAGRRIATTDPDTDSRATAKNSSNRSWRYLFNRVGDLAAVRDPRGCGQNFYYDHAGRLIAEHYVGCGEAQPNREIAIENVPSGAISLDVLGGSGPAADVRYYFDAYPSWFSAAAEGFGGVAILPTGALDIAHVRGLATGSMDRGQRSIVAYDALDRVILQARQLAVISDPAVLGAPPSSPPGLVTETPAGQANVVYDVAHTYRRGTSYDYASRRTGLSVEPFTGTSRRVTGAMRYNARGLPLAVDAQVSFNGAGIYNQAVVQRIDYTRDGLPTRVLYGSDVGASSPAPESTTYYDVRRRPERMYTLRNAGVGPSEGSAQQRPLDAVSVITDQVLVWDDSNNLIEVSDERPGDEWPDGFRPTSYRASHDSLYRVTSVDFDYTHDDSRVPTDTYVDYRTELSQVRAADPMRPGTAPRVTRAPPSRPSSLTYEYDWLANMVESTDDAYQFYERSLGEVSNGFEEQNGRPSALRLATDLGHEPPSAPLVGGERGGYLQVGYGEGGDVQTLTVHAQCVDRDYASGKTCHDPLLGVDARNAYLDANCVCVSEQHYQYRWDELNRLVEARRYDRSGGAGAYALMARQRYRYDNDNQRAIKQVLDVVSGAERVALEVFGGDFERRGMQRDLVADTYAPASSGAQEDQYLIGGARLVWNVARAGGYAPLDSDHRVTIALRDLIGSSNAVIDLTSHELVETSSYLPNGGRETFRTDGSEVGAEPSGFSGKEAEDEVGLTYFGERWLIARLGRWATPDPLSIHALGGGEFGNSYHYVSGNLLQGTDPMGLGDPAEKLVVETTKTALRVIEGGAGRAVAGEVAAGAELGPLAEAYFIFQLAKYTFRSADKAGGVPCENTPGACPTSGPPVRRSAEDFGYDSKKWVPLVKPPKDVRKAGASPAGGGSGSGDGTQTPGAATAPKKSAAPGLPKQRRDEKGKFAKDPDAPDSELNRSQYPKNVKESSRKQVLDNYTDENGVVRDANNAVLGFRHSNGRDVVDAEGNVLDITMDHQPRVSEHWNAEGHNQTAAQRAAWYQDPANMSPTTRAENSRDGALNAPRYEPKTGPNYTK